MNKTTTIVIGDPSKTSTSNPIVFDCVLNNVTPEVTQGRDILKKTYQVPGDFNFVELICKGYFNHKDLMFAYTDAGNRSAGFLFIGNWNDGIVA
jgi:hypothetical protein